ncbi:unnamed protein product [Symbiodinium natans]|uniref:Uncharacterized protein n=1 Tax=Symbiodinium natans TaxID=878477 RepID=A0A812J8W4_9DINO|nr:unnamed protein product [Symbiodinium natans]
MENRKEFLARRGDQPPERRLRENLADLFLSGEVSGKRARSLFEDAVSANATNVQDLAQGSTDHNAHRDVLRKLLAGTKWPNLFQLPLPIYNPKTDKQDVAHVYMMLPHEVLHALARWSDSLGSLASTEQLRPELATKLQRARRFLQQSTTGSSSSAAEPPTTVGIGLWADGVPIKGDRSESLEMLSMSLPGLQNSIRIPLTCLNKKYFLKSGETWDALFKAVAWSCHCMFAGSFPACTWDGHALTGQRAGLAGRSLLVHGVLLEIRGDWAMLKASFRTPSWSSKRNCCFVCKANPDNMRDVSPRAAWRAEMWSNAELLAEMLELHGVYSPIFEAPFVDIHTFCIDWLHCCDLGVCQDFMGNAMFLISQKLAGNADERVRALFEDIRGFYRATDCQDQLGTLTQLMIRKKASKSPKLRSKAGEARALVPWLVVACDRYLQGFGSSSEEETCRIAAKHLQGCYENLSQDRFDADQLAFHCRQFLQLYTALESAVEDNRWRYKPKFHVWLHLCEMASSSPVLFWVYRDESFGGTIATQSRMRGGKEGPEPMSKNLLNKFRAQHLVPQL